VFKAHVTDLNPNHIKCQSYLASAYFVSHLLHQDQRKPEHAICQIDGLAGLWYFTPTFVPYCMIPITYMHVYSISYADSRRLQLHGGVAIILTHLKQVMAYTTTARRAVHQRSCHLWLRSRCFASRYAA